MSLSSLGIIVALFSVTILIIVYLIDINRYKGKIVGVLKKNTGRTFHLQDRIYFTIYPWLGLNLGKVKVGNAPGFEALDFVDIDKVKVRIKLIPLLTKRFEIDTIRLEGMTVNFMRKSDGTNN
jgi:AsmA protein